MHIITKILTNNWFAALVLISACAGLYFLYSEGKILETAIGGVLIAIAFILILKGGRGKDDDQSD